METESPDSDSIAGIALHFPVNDSDPTSLQSTPRLPRRLRRRLLESKSPSTTAEDIEAKLRGAELRRQQFYEILSSKARKKLRSLTWSSSLQDEDLARRLEAKLSAAAHKRLSILAKVQRRLARLDELRQAAKAAAEMRFEKQRDELGSKVESRVHQAEVNRMLILNAHRKRRDAKKERTDQLLRRKIIKESKYKESIRAAIYRKRAAAEKIRLGVLEAQRSRARARVLLVQQVANSVTRKREIERTKLKDELACRLLKAQSLRAEYLKHRGNLQNIDHPFPKMIELQNILCSKLARCWRQFVRHRGTTHALAKEFAELNIHGESVKRMTFEQLASKIESVVTIQTTKSLLDRLESRIIISQKIFGSSRAFSLGNTDHLLKHVLFPSKGANADKPSKKCRSYGDKITGTIKSTRYPVRVVLCAYMIFGHPDMVFIGNGHDVNALADSAGVFVKEFDLLIKVISEGPIQPSIGEIDNSADPPNWLTFRSQLEAFDKAWCSYLYSFVKWKVKDAKLLEEDLVRAACQLEYSMLQARKLAAEDDYNIAEMKVLQKQVAENQKVLSEKLQQLAGEGGIKHLKHALQKTRTRFAKKKEHNNLLSASDHHIPSSSSSGAYNNSTPLDDKKCDGVEGFPDVQHESGPLLKLRASSSNNIYSLAPKKLPTFTDAATVQTENEILVNDIIHESCRLDTINEDQSNIMTKLRHTMEKAFWDGVIDSVNQDKPDYSWVLKLIKEVRDELCKISPLSWRQDIVESIDIDIISQMLTAGILDMDYLGRILEYSLMMLQKLCAPDDEDELKASHQKLLLELADISQAADKSVTKTAVVAVQGLRFVLEQIQGLKRSISKARIRLLEPYLKGPAGVEYLRNAFSKRYGPPSEACSSLPLVNELFSALVLEFENEWNEHLSSLSALGLNNEMCFQDEAPSTLRAGGGYIHGELTLNAVTSSTVGNEQPECKGEKVDLLLRLGLLRIVTEIEGLTIETLPETLKLNFYRLRAAQSELQKIIVICISILVLRQTLLTEQHLVSSQGDMEILIAKCVKQLYEVVDSTEDAGIAELVESMSSCLESDETDKSRARKDVVRNMLRKSLQAEDPVFTRTSHAIRLATRGVLLSGSGTKGRKLAESVLRRVGASFLTERLVEAVGNLLVVAIVSANVHRPWYEQVLGNL
ncbi:hypothetical protein DM860_002701 [Cuscuta australis]|uniref:T-complex protein 11 n=1 Tax=Cuscuta australis TaxID=267555 RepID=A0A328D478_9ASTE|nr:hypothetical protein DM860_002701 [Cuscuta australis]